VAVDKRLCVERAYTIDSVRMQLRLALEDYVAGKYAAAWGHMAIARMHGEHASRLKSPIGDKIARLVSELEEMMKRREELEVIWTYVEEKRGELWGNLLDDYLSCMEEVVRRR